MYLVFAYADYYAKGGSGDFVGAFGSLPEAWEAAQKAGAEYTGPSGRNAEIYDVRRDGWMTVDLSAKKDVA